MSVTCMFSAMSYIYIFILFACPLMLRALSRTMSSVLIVLEFWRRQHLRYCISWKNFIIYCTSVLLLHSGNFHKKMYTADMRFNVSALIVQYFIVEWQRKQESPITISLYSLDRSHSWLKFRRIQRGLNTKRPTLVFLLAPTKPLQSYG